MLSAIIDHRIRMSLDGLPDNAAMSIMEALSIPNLAKVAASQQNVFGWQQMPDRIDLWRIEDRMLSMPRGFASDLVNGMLVFGQEIKFVDRRKWNPIFKVGTKPTPKRWQVPAIDAMLAHEQGIYQAPAGSGKTVSLLATIQRLGCKSIIIVNTKDVMWQWQERVNQFLGVDYPFGQIGDQIFDVSPYITIATAQTLHSRYDELEADGFFDDFSFMALDECHHATADTYNRIVNRFSSKYRFGVSATPDKTGDFALATNVLGPIIHRTFHKDVDDLMLPSVVRVATKFGYGFRGSVNGRRSNYSQMIDALVNNADRNKLIVKMIMDNAGHHQLVISKRLAHLDLIETMLSDAGFPDPVVTITGPDDNEHRKQAKALAEVEPCVILSTLADEALDIPRLDRIHLTFPQKNAGLVTQQVGRVERVHPDKEDSIVFDYMDGNIGPLEKQWRIRRFEVYEPRGYKITTVKSS